MEFFFGPDMAMIPAVPNLLSKGNSEPFEKERSPSLLMQLDSVSESSVLQGHCPETMMASGPSHLSYHKWAVLDKATTWGNSVTETVTFSSSTRLLAL